MSPLLPAFLLAAVSLPAAPLSADTIELTNGKKYQGQLVQKTQTTVIFKALIGGSMVPLTLPANQVKSVVVDPKGPSPAPAIKPSSTPPAPVPTSRPAPAPTRSRTPGDTRTKAEAEALIEQAGKALPDWWESVPLNYPKAMDLTWAKASGPWNPNRWISQYFWSVIDPTPGKWKEGVKLLHHVLTVNKDDDAKLARTQEQLGRAYGRYLSDWARAAYWWRKAGGENDYDIALDLAEAYWYLGCKSMAAQTLSDVESISGSQARLWAQFGEPDRGLKVAQDLVRSFPHEAYLVSGDICRTAGRYKEAAAFYQKAVSTPLARGTQRYVNRAKAGLDAIKACEAMDLTRIPDGVYQGSGVGYRGEVKVSVTVKGGKIEAVKVVSHKEDGYFYYLCDPAMLKSIVNKQGLKGVDTVTGATVSAEGILNGAAKALAGGTKK